MDIILRILQVYWRLNGVHKGTKYAAIALLDTKYILDPLKVLYLVSFSSHVSPPNMPEVQGLHLNASNKGACSISLLYSKYPLYAMKCAKYSTRHGHVPT